ncbi:hypothetical protein EV174_006330 [Coemansia sp. RSA 2320]|nr:hypothetical protein EV174_006330 [Coemansia sp. RSA 2320]
MKRNYRKPLVVAGPKTLLRLSAATSSLEEMAPGTSFQPVLSDSLADDPGLVKRVVFVAGKLYYDLAKAYADRKDEISSKIAIVRVEEICPFPRSQLTRELERFSGATEFIWCQEETMNAGAYSFVQPRLQSILPSGARLGYIGREPLAAPVTGISCVYKAEQAQIIESALSGI